MSVYFLEPIGWVADALRLIAVSRGGLNEMEILTVLDNMGYNGDTAVTSFDWALFRSAASDALFEKPGGLLGFFHQNFKEAVEHTLLRKKNIIYLAAAQKILSQSM